MKAKKKVISILLMVVMTVALTGCLGVDTKITMKSDGSGTMSLSYMIDTSIDKYLKESGEGMDKLFTGYAVSKRTYDDNIYNCYEKSVSFANPQELKNLLTDTNTYSKNFMPDTKEMKDYTKELDDGALCSSASITNTNFQAVISGDESSDYFEGKENPYGSSIFMLISISYDKPIVYTNGTLSDDKMTASWKVESTVKDTLLQASTEGKDEFKTETNAPKITGVTNNKYYKRVVTVSISDDTGIESATCNGTAIARSHIINRDDKYVVIAKDFFGNKAQKTFYVDTVRPSVSGVMDGVAYHSKRTIRYTDTIGVKSATLNGKTFKSGRTVSRAGRYTLKVKDKAGNVRTVQFKIEK